MDQNTNEENNLLPVSMKIAAQNKGLDLIAVKPSIPSVIDMDWFDFKYSEKKGKFTPTINETITPDAKYELEDGSMLYVVYNKK